MKTKRGATLQRTIINTKKTNKMYRKQQPTRTTVSGIKGYQGETIEAKVRRIVNNKEPITDGAPLIYTDRKDGVRAEMDPRTDRWEIAVEAMDKVAKSKLAKREERQKTVGEQAKEGMKKEGEGAAKADGGAESTQATT